MKLQVSGSCASTGAWKAVLVFAQSQLKATGRSIAARGPRLSLSSSFSSLRSSAVTLARMAAPQSEHQVG